MGVPAYGFGLKAGTKLKECSPDDTVRLKFNDGTESTRFGPRRTLYSAGWGIVFLSVSVLCLTSGSYGVQSNFSVDPYYSAQYAVGLLPIYILLGAGLIVFSGYSPESLVRRHEAGPARPGADAVQSIALFAVAFCVFGILQTAHSETLALNLVKLRQQFTNDTLDIRMRRQSCGAAPGSGAPSMSQRSSRSRMPLWLNKAMWIVASAEVWQSSSSLASRPTWEHAKLRSTIRRFSPRIASSDSI